MSTPLRLLLRSTIGLFVAGVALVALAETAGASSHDVVEGVDVVVPVTDGHDPAGEARIAREATLEGQRVVVEVSIPEGYRTVTICVSEVAFTRPAAPRSCVVHRGPGDTLRHEAPALPGAELHVQVRVVTHGGVAWAGWQAGPPAYGSVPVPTLVEPPEDPPLEPPPEELEAAGAQLLVAADGGVEASDDGVEDPEPPLPPPGCDVDEAASGTGIDASTRADGSPAACSGRDAPARPAPKP